MELTWRCFIRLLTKESETPPQVGALFFHAADAIFRPSTCGFFMVFLVVIVLAKLKKGSSPSSPPLLPPVRC